MKAILWTTDGRDIVDVVQVTDAHRTEWLMLRPAMTTAQMVADLQGVPLPTRVFKRTGQLTNANGRHVDYREETQVRYRAWQLKRALKLARKGRILRVLPLPD